MNSEPLHSILRIKQVGAVTGLARSTIYHYVHLGKFPKPRKLGERAVGWLSGDVYRWVAEREVA